MKKAPCITWGLLLVGFSVLACSPSGSEAADESAPSATTAKPKGSPDEVRFLVRWRPSTIVIDGAADAWLRTESSPADGRYVFRENAALAALTVSGAEGKTVLLPKIGLFKIKSVARGQGKITLTTGPGSLLEAAEEGAISWEIDATNHEVVALQKAVVKEVADTETKPRTVNPLDSDSELPARESIDFHAKKDGYEVGLKMSNHVAGGRSAISFDIMGGVEESARGAVTSAKATLVGHVAFRSSASIRFKDGALLEFNFRLRDVELDANGTFEVDGMTVRGELVDYESRIIVPFLAGPVPLFYAIGGALNMNAAFGAGQSARISGHMTYKGDVGFEVEGMKVRNKIITGKPVLTGTGEPDVRTEASLIAEVAMPRIELGMGVPHLEKAALDTEAGVYVDLRAIVGANASMNLSSGPCFEVISALQAYYGAQATFFGLRLEKEAPLVKFADTTLSKGSCPQD